MQSRGLRLPEKPGVLAQKTESRSWQSPTTVATFVRCLRLLDLDLLLDWPGITEDTFSTRSSQQNLQARVKGVEWSLYRLFEIYDAKETQVKLRPFFPPLAPLQSLNLRAALYRSLMELKKNGILGKDATLRKTMLDECKGEKFEDVVGAFAMVVLRKTCRSKYPFLDIARLDHTPTDQLLPLIIAHRHSLAETLRKRRLIEEDGREYTARLDSEEVLMEKRQIEAQEGFQPVEQEDLERLSREVRTSWVGDDRVLEILLQGHLNNQMAPLGISYDNTWTVPLERQTLQENPSDLATELNDRIDKQKSRLKRWKTFQASLQNESETKGPTTKDLKPTANGASRLCFDQHKSLHLKSKQLYHITEERLLPYHQSLLNSMQEQVKELHTTITNTIPISSSQTKSSIPIKSKIKEDAFHTPPLKELTGSTSPVGKIAANTVVARIEFEHQSHNNPNLTPEASAEQMSPAAGPEFDSKTSILVERSRRSIAHVPPAKVESVMPDQADVDENDVTLPSMPSAERESIVALTNSDIGQDDDTVLMPSMPSVLSRRGTLLDRTRQSMSLLPNPQNNVGGRKSEKQPRFSEVFPISQFETPGRRKARNQEAYSPRSGSSTPRDNLFSEDADYASVFKSRPRIAVSPSLSPERIGIGLDSMLEEGIEDLSLGEDDADGFQRSPIRPGR